MKKQLIFISVFIIIVSIFVSCSVNSSSEDVSTTAVTDSNGTTHYYEPVTDDKGNISTTEKNQGVYAEIETQSNGKAVTENSGKYVTNEHTTFLPIESTTDSSTKKSKPDITATVTENQTTNTTETTATTATETTTKEETTTKKETQPATDKDGWITKWY